jgi:hypothetical protein
MPALLIAAALMGAAQAPAPLPPDAGAVTSVCSDETAHQFDFLLGDWTVTAGGGTGVLARAKVERVADGCGLLETDEPVKGIGATALMAYDAGATLWRRDQVSGDGEIVALQGGLQDGQMVLEGDQSGPGAHMLVRITWESNGEMVHEAAERSANGQLWNPWFERDYHKAAPPAPPPQAGPPIPPRGPSGP